MSVYGGFQDALIQHNSDVADPSVCHSHLAGRTDITDHTTATAVKVTNDGYLKVDVVSCTTEEKLTTMISSLSSISVSVGDQDGDMESVKTKLQNVNKHLKDLKNKQDLTNQKLETLNTTQSDIKTLLENVFMGVSNVSVDPNAVSA